MNAQSVNGLKWHVYPNPFNNKINIQFQLDKAESVKLTWRDLNGKIVEETIIENTQLGKNEYVYDDKAQWLGGTYLLTLETRNQTATQKVIFEE
jgi:hypothetical protein